MKRSTLALPLVFLTALLFATALGSLAAPGPALAADTGKAADKAPACKDWEARHEAMEARMAEMDQRLDSLVARMNAAKGDARLDAVMAVLNELVAQRAEMRAHRMGHHPHMGCPMAGSGCGAKECGKCGACKKGDCRDGEGCGKCGPCMKGDCPGAGKCPGCGMGDPSKRPAAKMGGEDA